MRSRRAADSYDTPGGGDIPPGVMIYAQNRIRKCCSYAARAPRGEQEKNCLLLEFFGGNFADTAGEILQIQSLPVFTECVILT